MARPSTAARRYAEAAFELASRDGAIDAWMEGLLLASGVLADPRIAAFVDNPAVSLKERDALVGRLLDGHMPASVVNLVKLLVSRGRVDRVPAVATEYRRLLNRARGIVEATVVTAQPLTDAETAALRARIAEMTGRTVDLSVSVDDALIGGITVRVGDTLYDASVRGRLERLRDQLVAGSR